MAKATANLVKFRNISPLEISILNRNTLDISGDKNDNKSHPTTFKNTRDKIANRNKQNTKKDV